MTTSPPPCPMSREGVVDRYYLEHRAKLLDVAAFLDRYDRAGGATDAEDDFRVTALRHAIGILLETEPGRTGRILAALSDPSDEPIDSAAGMKGAFGAWPGPGVPR